MIVDWAWSEEEDIWYRILRHERSLGGFGSPNAMYRVWEPFSTRTFPPMRT